jgi:hypothetical protein
MAAGMRAFLGALVCTATILRGVLPASAQVVQRGDLQLLEEAYPNQIIAIGRNSIIFSNGAHLDAGRSSAAEGAVLRNASIRDMFRQKYPAGANLTPPPLDFDPGRFRNRAFFDQIYGNCREGGVEKNLETVIWLPQSWGAPLRVTKVNGVAAKLQQISVEIERLPAALRYAAFPSAGAYACRDAADGGQPSMHAYGAAIDLNVRQSAYWLWQGRARPLVWQNRIPAEIVEIFERHGFIWGGRWYHFDTMHFEYRPELLAQARQ